MCWFVYWVLFSTIKDTLIAKAKFCKDFLTLKDYTALSVFLGQSGMYIFMSAQNICQFNSLGFTAQKNKFPIKYFFGWFGHKYWRNP